ncbi:PGPGW domain-containing protein [Colwelliaceae bacterium 6441]
MKILTYCILWLLLGGLTFAYCSYVHRESVKLKGINNMRLKIKNALIAILGFSFLAVGLVFILLPGPAVIFLPLGLALLSLQFDWAKVWLKRSQGMMRKSAVKLDNLWLKFKYRNR